MPEFVNTVIIGGGQAGLAMSHHLRARGVEHVVLERARIAERWRSERWNSLRFQLPNVMMRLPGHAYDGPDPGGFMSRDEVVGFIADYAVRIAAPVRTGVTVTRLRREEDGRFLVDAGPMTMRASHVVVATGPWQSPNIPDCAARLPRGIVQVTANRYTAPGDLPPGAVLVVGSGASGCQIVEDLLLAGRRVYYALRGHRRTPRRYRGRDQALWNETTGGFDVTADKIPAGFRSPLITGAMGGKTVDLRELGVLGATLLGSLGDIRDGELILAPDLNANLDAGDETFRTYLDSIDAFIDRSGIEAPPRGEFDDLLGAPSPRQPETERLDLQEAGIGTVIWAVGYSYDFGWVECPIFDARGAPVQQRGITAERGLCFLGLHRMHKVKSGFVFGVDEDAGYLAEHLTGMA